MEPESGPSTVLGRLRSLFDVPALSSRLEKERARILITILTAGTLVSGTMLLLSPIWQQNATTGLVSYGSTFLLHLVHIQLVRMGRPLLAARSFSVLFFLLTSSVFYAFGGALGIGGFVYPLVVLFTGLTWSATAAAGMAVAASLTALTLALFESQGQVTPFAPTPLAGAAWVMGSLIMTAVMLFVALRIMRASAQEALESERERRRLEVELARAQRMEALGQLAGGVAHDFNNMLTGIIGHAELVSLKAKDNPDLTKHSKLILEFGQKAARLTTQLLMFSRGGDRTYRLNSINARIENVIAILERSIDRRITVESRLEADPDVVKGDPALLEATLLNLAINARDALPEGGELVFETKRIPSGRDIDSAIQIRISDTGVGIPANIIDRIFEPYFTTKGFGEGTGLGLAAVYGTVRDHGGTVKVESEVSRGTTFTIRLPAANEPSERETTPPRPNHDTSNGPYCILVIDDEKPVLELVTSVLEGLGHTVLSAHDVDDGLAIFEERQCAIDIVVLDLVMPKMSGQQVLEHIRQRNENLPVILTSGYAGDSLAELLRHPNVGFLQKPYGRDDLASMVREITK